MWEFSSGRIQMHFKNRFRAAKAPGLIVQSTVHQLMKDLGVTSRLEAKSSRRRRSMIKAKKVCVESSKVAFVIMSGQSLG